MRALFTPFFVFQGRGHFLLLVPVAAIRRDAAAALPGMERAVELLERLAAERRPILT